MIIMIGSQKGGCGKSTLAANISAALAQRGRDVVLVDSDRQGTSANWAMDRGETDLPKVHCVQKYDNIRDTLKDLDTRYEFVVVDAAGRDSRELRTGMTAANILLVPFKPSQPDLDTLPKVSELIDQAKDLNPELRTLAVLTMAPSNPVVNEAKEAQEYLSDYPSLTLLNTVVRDRKVFRDAMSEGTGVVEMKNEKAAHEIDSLMGELI